MKHTKTYSGVAGEETFGTISEIGLWMQQNEIPLHAKLVYAGCGSHNIAFEWDDGKPEVTEGYWVYCKEVGHPERCWGWFQKHEPTEAEIEGERVEHHGREIEITWRKGTREGGVA